jgi:hypothetical protein
MSDKPVDVVVIGQPDQEPSETSQDRGACFDRMSDAEKAAVVKALGGLDKVRSNPALNDC